MNIDDLKASIILERRARNYPAGLVGSIYSENSDGEIFTLSIDAEVPVPINGGIGSSYEFPYYYSIALLTPAQSGPVEKLVEPIMDKEIEELNDTLRPRFDLIEKPFILISPPFKNPVDYEEFSATVELVATFIPNGRLRALRDLPPDSESVDTLADFLRTKCRFALSLVPVDGVSKINLHHIVKTVLKLLDANRPNHVVVLKKAKLTAGAKAMHGEYSLIDTRTNVVLIGCEAKETGATHRQCITQILSLCGNGAIEMRQRGVALDDCVTLGIAVAEAGIQFCAVYLMDSSFPMFVNLSPVLHPLHHAEEIAKWMLRFVCGASLALDTLHTATEPIQNLQLQLNTSSHFFKPVREGYKGTTSDFEPCQHHSVLPSRVDHIFRIYDRLYERYTRLDPRPTNWSISFPVGCITVPSQESEFQKALIAEIQQQEQFKSLNLALRPCLLFPRMTMAKKPSEALTVWRDFKPLAHLVEPFGFLAERSRVLERGGRRSL